MNRKRSIMLKDDVMNVLNKDIWQRIAPTESESHNNRIGNQEIDSLNPSNNNA